MKKILVSLLCLISFGALSNYVELDDQSTQQWEYQPTTEPYTFNFEYRVNKDLVLNLTCLPLQTTASFKMTYLGKEYGIKDLQSVFGYNAYRDVAQDVDLNPTGFIYGDFSHLFAQYDTIWFIDNEGKEIVTFPNDNRMAGNELFLFRKQCRMVVLH